MRLRRSGISWVLVRYATGRGPPTRVVVKGPIIDSSKAMTVLSEAF
jgi:hypothetical protein